MSKLIIITAGMHKIAEFCINIKYRQPGNVVEYLPVEFEVFIDHGYYRAMPLLNSETELLTNLPKELTFEIRGGKICNCTKGTEEILEEIVAKLDEMDVVEMAEKSFRRKCS
jgi:ABC-type dipeptide/oligopeptide/nickel transport system ATPase component